jgi:hypothetical protein
LLRWASNGIGIAFTAQQHATNTKKSQNDPTECPQRLGRVFRLACPSLGILGWEGARERCRLPNQITKRPTECPLGLERPFPPGVAESGHRRNTGEGGRWREIRRDQVASNRMPTTARATFSAWGRRARASSEQRKHTINSGKQIESVRIQPNARYGLSDLFRLGLPSQGILFFIRTSRHRRWGRARNGGRWSQKDAPMARVDSPPLICPGRGVQRGLRVQGLGFRVEDLALLPVDRQIRTLNTQPSPLNTSA